MPTSVAPLVGLHAGKCMTVLQVALESCAAMAAAVTPPPTSNTRGFPMLLCYNSKFSMISEIIIIITNIAGIALAERFFFRM